MVKQRLEVQGAIRAPREQRAYTYSGARDASLVCRALAPTLTHRCLPGPPAREFPRAAVRPGTWDALRKIWLYEGVPKGLFRGFSVTVLRDIPFAATYFATYDVTKRAQTRLVWGDVPDAPTAVGRTANHLIAGAWAGIAASLLTMPLDGIKTRMQTDRLLDRERHAQRAAPPAVAAAGPSQRGIVGTAAALYRDEGVPGFFRGVVPRLLSVIPSASVTFASYEVFKRLLGA